MSEVTTQNILSAFGAMEIFLFDFATFVAHAPGDRIRHPHMLHAPNLFLFLHQHDHWMRHHQ